MVIISSVPIFRIFTVCPRGDNKSTACGANARLQLLLENSKLKKGHNYVKTNLRATCPTGMGSPFESKQLV